MLVGLEPEKLSEIQEASGMIFNQAVALAGGNFEPTQIPELTPEEMGLGTPQVLPFRDRRDSEATVRYSPIDEDTSAKESVLGSPPAREGGREGLVHRKEAQAPQELK